MLSSGAWVVMFLWLATGVLAEESSAEMSVVHRYESGVPIAMQFTYSGNLADWDGTISVRGDSVSPYIECSNGAFFVISKDVGPFKPRANDGRLIIKCWEMLEAPRGSIVAPKNSLFGCGVAYNAVVNQPFTVDVDLTRFFYLEEPATYTVYWGCRPGHIQRVEFEVVP